MPPHHRRTTTCAAPSPLLSTPTPLPRCGLPLSQAEGVGIVEAKEIALTAVLRTLDAAMDVAAKMGVAAQVGAALKMDPGDAEALACRCMCRCACR